MVELELSVVDKQKVKGIFYPTSPPSSLLPLFTLFLTRLFAMLA